MACLDENVIAAYFSLKLSPRETESLFAHIDRCASCAQLFEAVGQGQSRDRESLSRAATWPGQPALDPAPATMLGRYRIERILGMGAMGVVYAGRDPRLDRSVAIKLLRPHPSISGELQRARLIREAQAMAQLSHPNVIHVHEIGSFGEQLFIVMELIDGTTLTDWLRAQPRTWREILQAFIAACAGLDAAHRAGIVHRDFKPDNVLVASDGRICVTDFGLALWRPQLDDAVAASPSQGMTSITRPGAIVGTLAYMAPEQLRGELADTRSDVFSFCVALHEALLRTRPYRGRTVAELQAAIEHRRLAAGHRRGPGWLKRAVVRGLEPRPADRYASLGELLAALRADPAPRRRRAVLGLGIAAVVASSAYFGHDRALRGQVCVGAQDKLAGIWDAHRKQALRDAFTRTRQPGANAVATATVDALDRYAQDWVTMHTGACEATRVRGEQSEELLDLRMQCLHVRAVELRALTDRFATADGDVIDHALDGVRALSALADCNDTEELRAGARRPSDPRLRAEVEALEETVARARVQYYGSGLRQSLELATRVATQPAAAAYPPVRAQALALRGMSLTVLQQLDEAEPVLKEAAQLGLSCRADRVVVQSWLALATLDSWRHRLDPALEWSRLAQSVIVRLGDDRLELKRVHSLVEIDRMNDRPREQLAAAQRGLALAERLQPPDEHELALSLYDLAVAQHLVTGDLEVAAALERRALAIYERHPDENLRELDRTLTAIDLTLAALGRYPEAEAMARRALALDERIFPADHPSLGYSLTNLADVLVKRERFADAARTLDRAEPIVAGHRDALGDLVPQMVWLRGMVELGLGHLTRATELLEQALAQRELTGSDRAQVELALAQARWQRGDRRRALEIAMQATAHVENAVPRDEITSRAIAQWIAERSRRPEARHSP
ncbi:MAG TPA: serine/threonine-protein kinase [Kofleriaceae bacterium]